MMGQDTAGDLNLCSRCLRRQVRGGRVEEEGFFRSRVVEFLDVVEVAATNGDDLESGGRMRARGRSRMREDSLTFLPCLKFEWKGEHATSGFLGGWNLKILGSI